MIRIKKTIITTDYTDSKKNLGFMDGLESKSVVNGALPLEKLKVRIPKDMQERGNL